MHAPALLKPHSRAAPPAAAHVSMVDARRWHMHAPMHARHNPHMHHYRCMGKWACVYLRMPCPYAHGGAPSYSCSVMQTLGAGAQGQCCQAGPSADAEIQALHSLVAA